MQTIFEKEIPDTLCNEQIMITNAILCINEMTVEDVSNKIQIFGKDLQFFINFIEIALKIRLNQRESLYSLLLKLSEAVNKTSNQCLLQKYAEVTEDVKKAIDLFNEESIVRIIMEDDVDKFIKFTESSDFDPNRNIRLKSSQANYIIGYKVSFSYMQLMAYFGSVKCFKYAYLEGSFNDNNTEEYAIAGGNTEIIHLLEQKDKKFDHLFNISVIHHRYRISDWLLNNYKCDDIPIEMTIMNLNVRAFLYIMNENISAYTYIPLIAFTYNISLVKWMIKEYNVDIEKNEFSERTLLCFACCLQSIELVKYLVEDLHANINDTDIEETNDDIEQYIKGKCVLHEACENEDLPSVKRLIEEEHFYVDQKYNGKTALHIACQKGNLDLVKFLIEECHADTGINENTTKTTILDIAKESENKELIKYICNLS